ncbi:unnamed protein product [Dracunculus medinensis]|uniref:ShKT domain-containing protein n=1 Tax=Dracunculus medinensis TaxID=318479 RepID=A0A0N4UR28_DRAME|nr:unnamed protein product [Dracunculus medinensis]
MAVFTLLLVLASLCHFANGGAMTIDVCSVVVVAGQNPVRRPSLPVENCQDRDPPACFEIFKYGNDEDQIPAENLVPTNDYKVPENCQKAEYRMLARQMCPQKCATCCLTKEYNCQNGNSFWCNLRLIYPLQ